MRSATDWTRPALSPLFTFAHSNGLISYPTRRSRILLVCCASTRFISILRGSFKDAFTAFCVISLKVILCAFLSSNFSAWLRCHEIASPSRSSSDASHTVSASLASVFSVLTSAFLSAGIS